MMMISMAICSVIFIAVSVYDIRFFWFYALFGRGVCIAFDAL